MSAPRVLVLRAPGTNCDEETAFAFTQAGGVAERVHVQRLLESPRLSREYQVLCVPGGFSYGDDLAAGRILAVQLQQHLADALQEFHGDGKLILGICNGFQVLLRTQLLLAEDDAGPAATLAWNDSGRFEDRWVQLEVASDKCAFLAGIEQMYLPVAHAEGKFVARSETSLSTLDSAGQLVLRYAVENGRIPSVEAGERNEPNTRSRVPYPANPNGSQANVAGICDATGRVFGLMPHPERFLDPTQHPRWTRGETPARGDGLRIFENAVRYFA